MASLFDVRLRPSEPTDQEISEAPLGTWKIRRRVHGPQKVVLRDLSIKGGDQTVDLVLGYRKLNQSPILKLLLSRLDEQIARVSKKIR